MTDDQLTALLSAAADASPSPALRARVAVLRPRRRLPLLALSLSGAAGTAAILAFALLPRVTPAEALLREAAGKQSRATGRFRTEGFRDGVWRLGETGLFAPGWMRSDGAEGELDLLTPTGRYSRSGVGAPILKVPDAHEEWDEMPNLDGLLAFFHKTGNQPRITADALRTDNGRAVREVTITLVGGDERERVTLDRETGLPLRVVSEILVKGNWRPTRRVTSTYPGPPSGSPEFWRGVDRSRIVDTAGLTREWARRLTPVLRTLTLASGKTMALRDVRATAAGDVFVLYTGAANVKARLTGADGTRYIRAAWDPNNGRVIPRNRPELKIGGEPLRGLWFFPETGSSPASGDVRLEILGAGLLLPEIPEPLPNIPAQRAEKPDPRATGDFRLSPVRDPAKLPAWAFALDSQRLVHNLEGIREDARLIAAYDAWLDANGNKVAGTYRLRPRQSDWGGEPPRPGLRRDPAAARAAITAFRRMMRRAEREHGGMNPQVVENWLARFEREARNIQP